LKHRAPDGVVPSLQVTVWPLYLIPTLALFPAPVGFASGKGKVKEPDEQGSRPSKAPQA
jgi:high-affinity iron transporter